MKNFLIVGLPVIIFCVACDVGTTSTPYINASTSGTCTGTQIQTNSCLIILNYSTGGNSGLSFGNSCQSVSGGTSQEKCLSNFSISFESCPVTNTNFQQTCTLPVTYTPNGSTPMSELVTFSLGSATSSAVQLSNH